jgi:hypothetical protein
MAVLEARSRRGKERFNELGLSKLAKEAKGVATDVLVRVLKVVSDAVTKYTC